MRATRIPNLLPDLLGAGVLVATLGGLASCKKGPSGPVPICLAEVAGGVAVESEAQKLPADTWFSIVLSNFDRERRLPGDDPQDCTGSSTLTPTPTFVDVTRTFHRVHSHSGPWLGSYRLTSLSKYPCLRASYNSRSSRCVTMHSMRLGSLRDSHFVSSRLTSPGLTDRYSQTSVT
jgi:hypothetical protein